MDGLYYYPFVISLHRCDGSYNTTEDPVGRINVPNKTEDANLKIFNMTARISESKHEKKIGKLSRKFNSKQKWNKHHCWCECKKPMKHRVYKEYYTWNPSICTCNYNKDCEILNNCTWIKSPSNNLVNMYDEIVDML